MELFIFLNLMFPNAQDDAIIVKLEHVVDIPTDDDDDDTLKGTLMFKPT